MKNNTNFDAGPGCRLALLAWFLLLHGCSSEPTAQRQGGDNRAQRVDVLFAHLNDGIQPGAAVLVIENGERVYSNAFGFADIDAEKRIDSNSTFRLASVSKQFTAMGIVALAEQGKLDLDDPIARYLPEQDAYAGVTIRHLLTHVSGIPDYYDEIAPGDDLLSNADVADFLASKGKPDFAAGERYVYSNSAYELLALIAETASGLSFARFMGEYVFAPADMRGALIHDHREPGIRNRVLGYDRAGDDFPPNDEHFLNGIVGSGGMYATLTDFLAWERALRRHRVVTESSQAEIFTRAALNDGTEIDYGLGWRLDDYLGFSRAAHGGSWVGFRTGIARYQEHGLTIVVLANRSDIEPEVYIDRISEIYLPLPADAFLPGSTFDQVQRQHRRLPDDDIWWTVNGADMAWNNKNLHQLFPTVNVYRDGTIRGLAHDPVAAIADYAVETPQGEITFDALIHSEQSTVMGVIVLHKGKIAYERYPRMRDHEMPVYWSVAKSFVGTVVRILEERGEIDVTEPIDYYIPEMAASDLAGTSVRDILDMASGLDCEDDYTDKTSCYYRYSMAIGDGFRFEDAPDNPYDFVATLSAKRHAEPGKRFSYSGLNTFVLAWLVEKVTGLPFQDVFSREVWTRIGAESNASYIAPRYGIAVTHGGFMARLRDVARFGLLFTPSYENVSETQIISNEHVDFLLNGGRPALFANAGFPAADVSGIKHNIYQWDEVRSNGDIYKGGWAGQGLLINPQRDVVAVFTGYFKDDDYSEVAIEPVLQTMLDDVFGSN